MQHRLTYEQAISILGAEHEAWNAARRTAERAEQAYFDKAALNDIRLCTHCHKPMPEYDHSMQCDGCHLPWNWCTPQGRRDERAAELDRRIAALNAERSKL